MMVATIFGHGGGAGEQVHDPDIAELLDAVAHGFSVFLVRPNNNIWSSLLVQQHPEIGCQVRLDRTGSGTFVDAAVPNGDDTPVPVGCCAPAGTTVPQKQLLPILLAITALGHFHETGEPSADVEWR
jgi:hypothetical protein